MKNDIPGGAQSDRRGDAGLVRLLLGRERTSLFFVTADNNVLDGLRFAPSRTMRSSDRVLHRTGAICA
jgi:hypothetical protein